MELSGLHARAGVGQDRPLERGDELAAGGDLLAGAGRRGGRAQVGGAPAHRALLVDEPAPLGGDECLVLARHAGVVVALGAEDAGEDEHRGEDHPGEREPAEDQALGVGYAREAAVVALAARRALGARGGVLGAAARAHSRRRAARFAGEDLADVVDGLGARIHSQDRTMYEWLIRMLATPTSWARSRSRSRAGSRPRPSRRSARPRPPPW